MQIHMCLPLYLREYIALNAFLEDGTDLYEYFYGSVDFVRIKMERRTKSTLVEMANSNANHMPLVVVMLPSASQFTSLIDQCGSF